MSWQVQILIVMGLQVLLKAPITAVWAIAKISGKSWQWTFSTGVAVAILLLIVLICVAIAMPKFRKLQVLTDDMNRITRENLTGLNVIRAYNAEDYQEKKFEAANDTLTKTQLFANRTMAFLMPSIQLGHERPVPGRLLDRRLSDSERGNGKQTGNLFGYDRLLPVCHASSHGLYDAGYHPDYLSQAAVAARRIMRCWIRFRRSRTEPFGKRIRPMPAR